MRLKIKNFSTGDEFLGDEISSVKIISEIDPLSLTLPSSVADITLKTTRENFKVANGDLITVYFNDKVEWSGYASGMNRTDKNVYEIDTYDLAEKLEKHTFYGGMYTDKNVLELVGEILAVAGATGSTYSSGMDEQIISGYLPILNCREALAQVLFAAGWYTRSIKTANYYQFAQLKSEAAKKTIARGRTFSGVKIDDGKGYSGIELLVHGYEKNGTEGASYLETNKWLSTIRGEATNVEVYFDGPVWDIDYSPPNKSSSYEVLFESANMVVVNYSCYAIDDGRPMRFKIQWRTYDHSTQWVKKYDESVPIVDVCAIEGITMVSENNAQAILDRCYEYYSKKTQATAKVVIGKHVSEDGTITYDEDIRCGDVITIPTDYQGTYTGRVVKEQYNLNGNIIIKEITIK